MVCNKFKRADGKRGRPSGDSLCNCGVAKKDHSEPDMTSDQPKADDDTTAAVDDTPIKPQIVQEPPRSTEHSGFGTASSLPPHLIQNGPYRGRRKPIYEEKFNLSKKMKDFIDQLDPQEAASPGSSWNTV